MNDTPDRDFQTTPLTPYEKALLCLTSFDLQYHDLRRKVESLLLSKRRLSDHQSAVLTGCLDELAEAVKKPTPNWGDIEK